MRKIYFAIICLAISFLANSQKFKPFKVDVSVGYATPSSGEGTKGGALFVIEPKYAINDNISLGLRLETALMVRATEDPNQELKGDVKGSGSYLATADYYFNTNDFRPFAGIGVGLFETATADLASTTTEDDINTASKFGVTPRAGFEYKHLRFGIEYNIAGKTGNINNNYLGIKLGVLIGGGRL